ncbi:dTDP-glucose 4,6-dehydratase [Cuniculiplasma sp. SKW4]|uniref:dTDP-glucose 4,6-dehydratase n=1 Tax=Cuniculiplasma sp. SKW4 TaxID=3400171 RepID=UPI003FD1C30A
MKILVTGGSGFIGSNYIQQRFEKSDDFIINMDKGTYASNPWYERNFPAGRYKKINDDINNVMNYEKELEDTDIIINFAAESHVDNSIRDSYNFLMSNIVGTQRLLEFARKHEIRFHQVSTDEVYGSLDPEGVDLFTPERCYDPKNPYSATKASADFLARSYVNTYGMRITISNCSNNYGMHQHPEKLIPKTIIKGYRYGKIPVYGNGEQIRDWIHVRDHNDALDCIIEKGRPGDVYLIGSRNQRKNIDVVRMILDIMDRSHDLIEYVKDRPGHDRRYAMDPSTTESLGWKPKIKFEEGLKSTVDHYVKNISVYEKMITPYRQ